MFQANHDMTWCHVARMKHLSESKYSARIYLLDTSVHDPLKWEWMLLDAGGVKPEGRIFSAVSLVGHRIMIAFGL